MTYEEKFEELKKTFNIDESCQIIVNKGDDQVVYQIWDKEDNEIWIDFNLIDKNYRVTFDFKNEEIFSNAIEKY